MSSNNFNFQEDSLRIRLYVGLGFFIIGGILAWSGIGLLLGKTSNITSTGGIQAQLENPLVLPRRIDGRIVAREEANLMPIGVMIENLPSVRPQSGLSRASVVYEALAEGFSTRFLVIYDPKELPNEIGPVRSSRPYYLEWISEYDGLYVHAGGSPESLAAISGLKIKDLNALWKGQYFWRDHSDVAPHNLYTSRELLDKALRDLNYQEERANFDSWKFKDDPSLVDRPEEAKNLKIKFSGYSYEVEYQYDRAANEYLRFNGGQKHTDENNGEQLRAKNVVAVIIPPVVDIGEKGRLTFNISGEGRVVIARDGEILEGVWKKPDRVSRYRFYDQSGKEIELGRGSTWVHILPETQEVEY